jgi:hypothetical protein
VLQVDGPLVVGEPIGFGDALHAFGVEQVQRCAAVLLPGRQRPATLFVLLRHRDQPVGNRRPGGEELLGARVDASGGGLADGAAGLVDFADRAPVLQGDQDGQVPHVVAGEVLEHR